MASTEPSAVVTTKILIEQNEVTPVRAVLEKLRSAVDGPGVLSVTLKESPPVLARVQPARTVDDRRLRACASVHIAALSGEDVSLRR